jgi:hypothetical protein
MKGKLPFSYHGDRYEKAVSFYSFLTLAVNGQLHAPVEEPPVSTEQKALLTLRRSEYLLDTIGIEWRFSVFQPLA